MGDENQRSAAFGLLGEEKIGDLAAGVAVEIAGGFVGDDQRRIGSQRPGDRHALLLAARQLSREMRQAFAEPHGLELGSGALEGVAAAGEFQRHGDIFERRHVGDEVEGLEDDADGSAAHGGEIVLGEIVQGLACDEDLAAVEPFETGNHHQKRRLARPRRSDDTDGLARLDFQVHAFQDTDRGGAGTEGQVSRYDLNDGFRHGSASYIVGDTDPDASAVEVRSGSLRFKVLPAQILVIAGLLVALALPARAETIKLVGFGDSLMAAYDLAKEEGFPARLQAALRERGHDVEIADAGVSGDTTSGGLSRLDWSVPDGTDGVILELGANDALRGIAPEKTRENLEAMIERLKERGIPVLLAGMLAPPNMGPDYEDKFNSIYPELAEKYDLVLYPFFLDGVAAEPDLVLSDGMHPNPAGVDEMVKRFVPVAEEFLGRIGGERPQADDGN